VKTQTLKKLPPVKGFTIAAGEKRLSEIVNVNVGDRFLVTMPKPPGRIVEPGLGFPQEFAQHDGTSDDGETVWFDFTAVNAGIARLEFPLIDSDWDGACDPDPKLAEPYLAVWLRVSP
jgi:hypothetical protein